MSKGLAVFENVKSSKTYMYVLKRLSSAIAGKPKKLLQISLTKKTHT